MRDQWSVRQFAFGGGKIESQMDRGASAFLAMGGFFLIHDEAVDTQGRHVGAQAAFGGIVVG